MPRKLRAADIFREPRFPLRVMRVRSHRRASRHSHEFHELVVILGGSGRHITSTEEYPIEAGDVFLISGSQGHSYENTDRLTLVNILFDPSALNLPLAGLGGVPGYHALFQVEPELRRRRATRGRLRLRTDQLAESDRLISLLEDELRQRAPGYRFMACAELMQLIGHLSRCCSESGAGAKQRLLSIGAVLSYVDKHFPDPITVAQLARVGAMSESSLTRAFRNVMSRSPIDYVIHVRVKKAADMLRHTDTRITDVAFACGFSDANYFSRVFKRTTGRSPREFRRAHSL
jgi:AraC family L-rhamnose operon transcriptional activator RhaR/AraC family L-rhamnose operon regulatory protein RhaS